MKAQMGLDIPIIYCQLGGHRDLRPLPLAPCESESKGRSVVSDFLRPHGLYNPWNSPGQNTGVGSLSLLQGIFPTQGSNPGLPHCRHISLVYFSGRCPTMVGQVCLIIIFFFHCTPNSLISSKISAGSSGPLLPVLLAIYFTAKVGST